MLKKIFFIAIYGMVSFFAHNTALASAPDTVTSLVTDSSSTFASPLLIVFTPDGTKAYVSNTNGNGPGDATVSIVDVATNTVTGLIGGGSAFGNLQDMAINPAGSKAYITNGGNTFIIDITSDTISGTVPSPDNPTGVAFFPDGTKAYVSNRSSDSVSIIDVASNTIIGVVSAANFNQPTLLTFTPDGSKAYVINRGNNTVSVIDALTDTVIGTVAGGTFSTSTDLAVSPDGSKLYVTNVASGLVSVIDTSTDTQTSTISGFSQPVSVAFTPDSTTAYVSNATGNTVSMIAVSTNTIARTVSDPTLVIVTPQGVAVSPNGKKVYVSNRSTDNVAVITNINASCPTNDSPPQNAQARAVRNIFLTGYELTNVLSWAAPSIVSYSIYRNSLSTQPIATVPATGLLQYIDHNVQPCTTTTYYIVAIDQNGNASTPATVTVAQ